MGHKKRKREIAWDKGTGKTVTINRSKPPKCAKSVQFLPGVSGNYFTLPAGFYGKSFMDVLADDGMQEIPVLPVRQSETPIIGYRAWSVVEKDGRFMLQSPVVYQDWEGPMLRASDKPSPYDPHAFPVPGTVHGLYAHNEPDWSDFVPRSDGMWVTVSWSGNQPNAATLHTGGDGVAMGRVEATGTVVVHETGFRAEIMRITKLVLSPHLMKHPGIVEQMSRTYACDVSFDPATLEDK
jgi:hypothetical protein